MLPIGIESTYYFNLNDYKEGFRKLKSHGYDCIDYQGFISPSSPLYELEDKDLKSYLNDLKITAENSGVKIWQMHGIWPHDDTTKESRDNIVRLQKKAIRAAGILGCKYFVLHPAMPYGWGEEKNKDEAFDLTAERFLSLLPVAKSEGVTLCLENMPFAKWHSFSCIEDVKRLVTTVNDDSLKVCFDTGHCNVTKEDHYEAITKLGKDLACLHVHDDRSRQDRHLIPYFGEINWEKVIKGLREISFNGCISLETGVPMTVPEPMREEMSIAAAKIARYIADKVCNK